MLLDERMLFRQAHNPLVDAYIMQPLNRWNDHAGRYKDPSAPSPELRGSANTGDPLGPNRLLELVPELLQG